MTNIKKIVVNYEIGGGYECGNYEQTLCFEYDSPEAFLCEFQVALEEAKRNVDADLKKIKDAWDDSRKNNTVIIIPIIDIRPKFDFTFCGYEWQISDFYFGNRLILPEVRELNEWFEERKAAQ